MVRFHLKFWPAVKYVRMHLLQQLPPNWIGAKKERNCTANFLYVSSKLSFKTSALHKEKKIQTSYQSFNYWWECEREKREIYSLSHVQHVRWQVFHCTISLYVHLHFWNSDFLTHLHTIDLLLILNEHPVSPVSCCFSHSLPLALVHELREGSWCVLFRN